MVNKMVTAPKMYYAISKAPSGYEKIETVPRKVKFPPDNLFFIRRIYIQFICGRMLTPIPNAFIEAYTMKKKKISGVWFLLN